MLSEINNHILGPETFWVYAASPILLQTGRGSIGGMINTVPTIFTYRSIFQNALPKLTQDLQADRQVC